MKSFEDFIAYAESHAVGITEDATDGYIHGLHEGSLSKEDIVLITKICQSHTISLLRAYHEWLTEDDLP